MLSISMTALRQRLRRGDLLLGCIISEVRTPSVPCLLAQNGFDYMIIDNEHGSYTSETVADLVAGARAVDFPVIVRVPEIRREAILKPLEAGAAGLLVPQVDTAEQAAEVVQYAKYAPLGKRGVALRRAHNRYQNVDAAAYLREANE